MYRQRKALRMGIVSQHHHRRGLARPSIAYHVEASHQHKVEDGLDLHICYRKHVSM